MKNFEIYGCELIDANNIFPFKNINFIVDFVRFNRGKENDKTTKTNWSISL